MLELLFLEIFSITMAPLTQKSYRRSERTRLLLDLGVDMDAMQAGASVKAKTKANSRLKNSVHGYD